MRSVAWLPVVCVLCVGCGLSIPATPTVDGAVVDIAKSPDVTARDLVLVEDQGAPRDAVTDAPSAEDIAREDAFVDDRVALDAPPTDASDAVVDDVVDAQTGDAPDASSDVPVVTDVPVVDVRDVPAIDVSDAPTVTDVPDVPVATDVPDVPIVTDVPVVPDVPTVWRVRDGNVTYTTWRSEMPGGPYTEFCPAGELMVGAETWANRYVDGLAVICARLNADGSWSGQHTLATHGTTINEHNTDVCPPGQAVVEVVTHAGNITDNIGFRCAPVIAWVLAGTRGASLTARGGPGGGAGTTDTCPASAMATGMQYDTDNYVLLDRIGQSRMRCTAVGR